jgi:hypothetical protein
VIFPMFIHVLVSPQPPKSFLCPTSGLLVVTLSVLKYEVEEGEGNDSGGYHIRQNAILCT